ncbi:hypothetical protein KUTeg_020843, partial [Tegillarca granosa]
MIRRRASLESLLERLQNGGSILTAEGYIFEFERKGYLKAGTFVPEVVLDYPDLVRAQHEEYVHAGSDVVLAFTYYAHREKLRLIGKEDMLEKMNTEALRIAREVADRTGTLMAGNICNSTEQVEWAVKGGADFIVAETFGEYGEAALALKAIKQYGQDDVPIGEACKMLEDEGAAVVGLNCNKLAFPLDLASCYCTRDEIRNFAMEAKDIGVQYIGLCCGNSSNYFRIVADVYGKSPPANKFAPEMEKHYIFGKSDDFSDYYTKGLRQQML